MSLVVVNEGELSVVSSVESENIVKKKRGFWLTGYLVLMFIANPFSAYVYLSQPEEISSALPGASIELIYFLAAVSILNVVLAALIWSWKKVGVFGFYFVAIVAFGINVYLGLGLVSILIGLLGAVTVFLTTRNRWEHFA